ncbi:hypothetical protein OG552_31360 [Streptomyces sp. NBC_01476]|uniref:PH domain-containing protein n=1 Tax=Streptomyces sp. NBC_01476 TaxID=2903881 RepID=UPI002E37DB8C|nr:hypothetical protein [Streptomyces sp. NBC_01476]
MSIGLLNLFLVGCLTVAVVSDPSWWRDPLYALAFLPWGAANVRSLRWRITAVPQGLRVRLWGRTGTLPWESLHSVVAERGGSLVIIGSQTEVMITIRFAGPFASERIAAEIDAMIADPTLRPHV